jgi:hypothetical protein
MNNYEIRKELYKLISWDIPEFKGAVSLICQYKGHNACALKSCGCTCHKADV